MQEQKHVSPIIFIRKEVLFDKNAYFCTSI